MSDYLETKATTKNEDLRLQTTVVSRGGPVTETSRVGTSITTRTDTPGKRTETRTDAPVEGIQKTQVTTEHVITSTEATPEHTVRQTTSGHVGISFSFVFQVTSITGVAEDGSSGLSC